MKPDFRDRWYQVKDRLRSQWSRLSETDLEHTEAGTVELSGLLSRRYGLGESHALREAQAFYAGCQDLLHQAGAEHVAGEDT